MRTASLSVLIVVGLNVVALCSGQGCLESAWCNQIRGDIGRDVNDPPHHDYYELADVEMLKHEKYLTCGIEFISKKCEPTRDFCLDFAKNLIVNSLFRGNFNRSLLAEDVCGFRTWPYLVGFCIGIRTWPRNIVSQLPPGYTNCRTTCKAMSEFDAAHKRIGRTNFPATWAEDLAAQAA